MNMKYVREPGYVYDLFSPFVIYFNKETFLEAEINKNAVAEERKYFENILDYFSPFSEALYPFFYMKDNARTFMTQHYFYAFKSVLFSDFSFRTVLDALKNHREVQRHMLRFFFNSLDDETLDEYINSLQKLCLLIGASRYNDKLKCGLITIFADPDTAIQQLVYALQTAEVKLSQYYEKNYQKLMDLQWSIDIDNLQDNFSLLGNHEVDLVNREIVYFTLCLAFKNCIKAEYVDRDLLLMLGSDHESRFRYLHTQNNSIQLDLLGAALSEPNRVEIFELMYNKGEITVKDIEQTMKISGTNAYYHLMMMLKANIIQTRNQGRTVCYSINKNHVDLICRYFSKYGNKPLEVR